MLATNHAFSGSLFGALMPLPIAIPMAFVSHFVLDMIPHYGISHEGRNHNRVYKLIVYSDTFIALSYAVAAAFLHKWNMEITGWIAWSPDLLWVIYYFKNGKNLQLVATNRFMKFHMTIQKYERPWGIIIDLLVASVFIPLGILFMLK